MACDSAFKPMQPSPVTQQEQSAQGTGRSIVMRQFGLLIMCLLLWSGGVRATEFPLEIIENFDGTKVAIYVRESAIDEAPTWDPAEGEPPLTIARMTEAVRQWIDQDPGIADVDISKIELKPILHHEAHKNWYYLVQLKSRNDVHAKPQYVAVLMSGKVLPAIKEPSSYK